MDRAYSTLTLKGSVSSSGARIFTGIASTLSTDKYGDVVYPDGAVFELPISLLWQHDVRQPLGWVKKANVKSYGIEIEGEIANIQQEGNVKTRIDDIWTMILNGLVKGLSIGFRAISAKVNNTKGYDITKWLWNELSIVTIPANSDASISSIKSIDSKILAAIGNHSPGDTGKFKYVALKGKVIMKTIAEQIAALEATRLAKTGRMTEVMEKSLEGGRSTDEAEGEEFDTLQGEVKKLDSDLVRLRELEKMNVQRAKPIEPLVPSVNIGTGVQFVKENLPQGIRFARLVKCLYASRGNPFQAEQFVKQYYPDDQLLIQASRADMHQISKAAVSAGTTTDSTWAGTLVNYQNVTTDFIEFLRPQTIIGKFGVGGIPALKATPFNVKIQSQTSGGSGYWVGQGAAKPLTKFDFAPFTLLWSKVANIAVLSEEILRFSNPNAEMLVRNGLADALIARLDIDFVDPDKAEVANISPASITNGVTAIESSGNSADDVRTDVKAAVTTFINASIGLMSGVWIMPARVALSLSMMRNALGQREFPDISMLGGRFEGFPVIVSEHVPDNSDGSRVVLANAQDIYLADDGVVSVDASREASLQMLDNPTNNSSTATATTMVSMFQTDSVALRAERYINWKKARAAAVTYVDSVNWGTGS